MKFELFSQVYLAEDILNSPFKKGDAATVVEQIEGEYYLIEIFDSEGNTIDVIPVVESAITKPAKRAILAYREFRRSSIRNGRLWY